jgi:hypothetical protein
MWTRCRGQGKKGKRDCREREGSGGPEREHLERWRLILLGCRRGCVRGRGGGGRYGGDVGDGGHCC